MLKNNHHKYKKIYYRFTMLPSRKRIIKRSIPMILWYYRYWLCFRYNNPNIPITKCVLTINKMKHR